MTFSGLLSNGTTLTKKTLFSITKSDPVLSVALTPASGAVAFNESLVLDSTGSYDPDYPNQTLQVQWSFGNGYSEIRSSSSPLIFNPFDKVRN